MAAPVTPAFGNLNPTVTRDEQLNRELFQSVIGNKKDKVEQLISEGADINFKDRKERTLVITALILGHFEMAKFLLEKGADKEGAVDCFIARLRKDDGVPEEEFYVIPAEDIERYEKDPLYVDLWKLLDPPINEIRPIAGIKLRTQKFDYQRSFSEEDRVDKQTAKAIIQDLHNIDADHSHIALAKRKIAKLHVGLRTEFNEKIRFTLWLKNKKGIDPDTVTDSGFYELYLEFLQYEKSQTADRLEEAKKKTEILARDLIEEENKELKVRQKAKEKRKQTKGKKRKGKENSSIASTPHTKASAVRVEPGKKEKKQGLFVAPLSTALNKASSFRIHQRVSRWWCSPTIEQIKDFADGPLFQYRDKTDEELNQLLAYHNVQGVDRILRVPECKSKYCFEYSFFDHADRERTGYGMMATLFFDNHATGKREEALGIIYLGISEKQEIFHAMFEKREKTKNKVLLGLFKQLENRNSSDAEGWEAVSKCTLEVKEEGIHVTYDDSQIQHPCIIIHPLILGDTA